MFVRHLALLFPPTILLSFPSIEVLNIIGFATKEIKQGKISASFLYNEVPVDRTIFREIFEEAI